MSDDRLRICSQCRFPNLPGARTCLTCKSGLSEPSDEDELFDEALPALSDAPTRAFVRGRAGGVPRPVELRARPPASPEGPIVGWLRCEPLPPIALGPKHTVTLGRGQECDLILPHPTVSRVHALIRVLGRQMVLEDRSSYGSYLNARPVSSAQLQVGDRIGIGPYEVRVLAADATEQGAQAEEEHTQPLDFSSFRQVPERAELLGSLERVSLLEILQTLELHGKTGTLKVTSGALAGVLVVRDGRPLSAALGELRDDEAVLGMVLLRQGSFCFWGDAPPDATPTMSSSLTRLLLEASRRLDESDLSSTEDTHHPGR